MRLAVFSYLAGSLSREPPARVPARAGSMAKGHRAAVQLACGNGTDAAGLVIAAQREAGDRGHLASGLAPGS